MASQFGRLSIVRIIQHDHERLEELDTDSSHGTNIVNWCCVTCRESDSGINKRLAGESDKSVAIWIELLLLHSFQYFIDCTNGMPD